MEEMVQIDPITDAYRKLWNLHTLLQSEELQQAISSVKQKVRTLVWEPTIEVEVVTTPNFSPDRLRVMLTTQQADANVLLDLPDCTVSLTSLTVLISHTIELEDCQILVSCELKAALPEEYIEILRLIGKIKTFRNTSTTEYEALVC